MHHCESVQKAHSQGEEWAHSSRTTFDTSKAWNKKSMKLSRTKEALS